MRIRRLILSAFVLLTGGAIRAEAGPEVWAGDDSFFQKPDFADSKLPENQDRITENVWITRDNAAGLYNRATESIYSSNFSPADTEWATGSALDWDTLQFTTWEQWFGGVAGGGPPSILGVDAVMHLITDDIYVDIRLETWTIGSQGGGSGGGGFSYFRGSDPTPTETTSWSGIKTREYAPH